MSDIYNEGNTSKEVVIYIHIIQITHAESDEEVEYVKAGKLGDPSRASAVYVDGTGRESMQRNIGFFNQRKIKYYIFF